MLKNSLIFLLSVDVSVGLLLQFLPYFWVAVISWAFVIGYILWKESVRYGWFSRTN